jgi:Flp pilus assembly pilin Flp
MRHLLDRFRRDHSGAAIVEYAVLLGLVAAVTVLTISTLGHEVSSVFSVMAADMASI